MKVKIFHDYYLSNLEKHINDFISDKKVIDIKYGHTTYNYSALIMYKEGDK